ncbi:hypothetical protein [Armatimonas rosea]|uniref:Uncharacterized protein n=1 Tax=Armatimonas rosea TaxID=685828 RepID=A0A7W9SN55_ARMRO|nr:hypothetical protein [Armatimonas rosea]MBB6049687.1 hypothetical protein [Armatimonas rosea]
MAYSNFTDLSVLRRDFGLTISFQARLFDSEYTATPSDFLRTALREYEPLALAIGTEKARSELLIMPILAEVRRQCDQQISLFSGVDFNVDAERGLNGYCDYLLSRDSNPYSIHAPVFAVVEAKNEKINLGLAQCAAELVAARIFNAREDSTLPILYGAVTTGSNWRFLRLTDDHLEIDGDEEYLHPIERLLGILLTIAS